MRNRVILLFVFLLILTSCGKQSESLVLPSVDDVNEVGISIILNGKTVESNIYIDSKNITEIMDYLLESEPTTIESINDFPNNNEVVEIDFVTVGEKSTFFVYKERRILRERYYIERPYYGVWEIDESVYKRINNF